MSLINEALKRARRVQQAQPAAQTAATPSLQPVNAPRHAEGAGGLWLPILIGVTLFTSGVLLWQWFDSGRIEVVRARSTPAAAAPAPVSAPAVDVSAPTVATAPTPTPAPKPFPLPPVASDAKTDQTNAVVATPEAPAAATAPSPTVAVETPKAPAYKLQGIFFRRDNPSAVVDGKLVFEGSRVTDGHVLLIEKDAVTIVTSAGQTNLLELP